MFKWIPTVIAALCLYAVPAKSAEFTRDQEYLINTLEQAGVTIIADDCPGDDYYGLFSAKENTIVVCTNVAISLDQRWETLRHESVHAAQACIDPTMQSTAHSLKYVYDNLSKSDFRAVRKHYHESNWRIEYEAFTFMRYSNSYVAAMVETACL